jgi:hypothetical protein
MNAVILKLLFYKLNNLDFLMIIMKHILICTPYTILPNYCSFITPLINNVHLGHSIQEIHLG